MGPAACHTGTQSPGMQQQTQHGRAAWEEGLGQGEQRRREV